MDGNHAAGIPLLGQMLQIIQLAFKLHPPALYGDLPRCRAQDILNKLRNGETVKFEAIGLLRRFRPRQPCSPLLAAR